MAHEAGNLPSSGAPALDKLNNSPFKPRSPDAEAKATHWKEGLRSFDVFSLIVNKMIGTGIYTSPAVVYRMTGSKSITLALFGVGFLYCLLSAAIYLQFAEIFPYNGGELIYLDEITASKNPTAANTPEDDAPHQEGIQLRNLPQTQQAPQPAGTGPHPVPWYKRLLGDGLLAYIIYSLTFIFVFNSATNSQQFGRMILLCLHADEEENDDDIKNDQHLMRFIAVTVLSIICLVQFFSPAFGRKLNKHLAVIKIGFLLGLVVVGLAALGRDFSSERDNGPPSVDRGYDWFVLHKVHSPVAFAKALLLVLFSFEGWENATFVAGDIRKDQQNNLRRGFLGAVFTVGSLYLIVVAVSLNSLTWQDVEDGSNINYAPLVIGQAEVLPWSQFLKKDDSLNRNKRLEENAFHFKSPQGGLIAHWLGSVAMISVSASIQSTLESIGLAGYIQTYTHCFILMVLGGIYFKLKSRQRLPTVDEQQFNRPGGFYDALVLVLSPLYALLNLAIVVINVVPPYKGSGDKDSVFPGYGFLIIVASLIIVGTIYYLLFFGAVRRSYEVVRPSDGNGDDHPFSHVVEGILSPESPFNLMKYAGVVCEMKKDRVHNKRVERVFRFGRRWRMRYYLEGYDPKDSDQSSKDENADVGVRPNPIPVTTMEIPGADVDANPDPPPLGNERLTMAMVLYWTFGGTRLRKDLTPWAKLKGYTEWLFPC
ncbi:hypothetical protein HG531_013146 [Fusarium graminearum]|nr:hypothetical protein HG531_013146 [Fusarium graminearum]